MVASLTDASSNASCVRAETVGKGAAIEGSSTHGYGAKLAGALPLLLIPSTLSSHPHSSSRGALFVDHGGRLWFCKGGTSWHQLA
jgi:hypothetical protein